MSKAGSKVNVDLSKDISKEIKKQLDSVLKEIESYDKKINEAVNKAASDAGGKGSKAKENKQLKEAIALWKEYYTISTRAQNAENSGRTSQATFLRAEAEAIRVKAAA